MPSVTRDSREARRVVAIGIAVVAAASGVCYAVGLVLDWPSWLRGIDWIWRRVAPDGSAPRLLLLAFVAAAWLGVVVVVIRGGGEWRAGHVRALLAWAVLFTPLVQIVSAAQQRSQPLSAAFMTTVDPREGFFEEGVKMEDPVAFVQGHLDHMPDYRGVHLQTQPPGWAVAFWGARGLWERMPAAAEVVSHWLLRSDCTSIEYRDMEPAQIAAATLQMSLLVLSGLGAIPLYLLGREVFSERAGRLAVAAYPLVPGLLAFQSKRGVLYAIVTTTAVWLARRAVTRGRWGDALLLGVLLAGTSLLALQTTGMAGLIGAYLLAHVLLVERSRGSWRAIARIGLAVALTLVVLWGGLWLVWGVSWLEFYTTGSRLFAEMGTQSELSVIYNPYDFGVFLGLPLAAWAVVGGVGALWRGLRLKSRAGDELAAAWIVTIAILHLSGYVQAEAGRIWLFLVVPGVLIGAASLLAALDGPAAAAVGRGRARTALLYAVVIAFGVQSLAVGYYMAACDAPLPELPPVNWSVPSSAEPLSYRLGDWAELAGYEISLERDKIELTIYWRALARTDGDYSVFVHALGEGDIVAQSDGTPAAGSLPTWCWLPGEVVADVHVLEVGGQEPDEIGVGLYDWRDGLRLPVSPPVADDLIRIPAPTVVP
jgi:hypothetical protein